MEQRILASALGTVISLEILLSTSGKEATGRYGRSPNNLKDARGKASVRGYDFHEVGIAKLTLHCFCIDQCNDVLLFTSIEAVKDRLEGRIYDNKFYRLPENEQILKPYLFPFH